MIGAQKFQKTFSAVFSHWRTHHAREAGSSFRRLVRTPISTGMTLLVVAMALALPVVLSLLLGNVERLTARWDGQAQISVYLRQGITAEAQTALQQALSVRADVRSARLVTPAQALDEFRAASGYGEALSLLDNNPLPAVMVIQPADIRPQAVQTLRDTLAALPDADAADIDLAWVQRLAALLALGQHLLLALAGALIATVLLVIGNTIRLGFESRKDEVQVLTLLGATDGFVRRPFMYSGLWTGLAGGVLACVAVSAFFWWLDAPVQALAALYDSSFSLQGLSMSTALALIGGSALLGLVGAWLAINRHLAALEL